MTPTAAEDHPALVERTYPADPVLVPALSPRWALTKWHVALTATLALLFLVVNHLPLRGTDLWCHVVYGQWILEHGALPTADPVMPLAAGMRVVDSAWLSQTLLALVRPWGDVWLANLFALVTLATYALLAGALYRRCGRLDLALVGLVTTLAIGWSRLTTIRPEIFAGLLFAALLGVVTRIEAGRYRWFDWLAVPAVLAVWANAHGSFPVGLLLLSALAVGQALDVAWRARSPWAALADRSTQRWFWLAELGAVATLVNPYGADLWLEVARFANNSNLGDLVEWFPMTFWGVGGLEFSLAWLALTLVLRHGRRPMPVAHVLLLISFGLAAAARVRMMTWFAPVYAWVVLPHLAELTDRFAARRGGRARCAGVPSSAPYAEDEPGEAWPLGATLPPGHRWSYTLVCGVICWMAFSLSDLCRPLMQSPPRSPSRLYGAQTPLATTAFLESQPPRGLVLAPQPWADWFVTHGPSGFQPMVTSNVHLVPRKVWQDYQHIALAQPGWQAVADRYLIGTIIVDKAQQPILTPVLRRSTEWRVAHEDETGIVFQRVAKAG